MPKLWKDILERFLWTAAQGAAGAGAVYVTGLPYGWVPVFAAALSFVKGYAAQHVGDSESASTVAL